MGKLKRKYMDDVIKTYPGRRAHNTGSTHKIHFKHFENT